MWSFAKRGKQNQSDSLDADRKPSLGVRMRRVAGNICLNAVLLPPVILFVLGLLLYLPFDLVRYYRSAYFKETRERYYLFGAMSACFKRYSTIKAANLPISFYRNRDCKINAAGYFVYKNILLSSDMVLHFDAEQSDWFLGNEYDQSINLDACAQDALFEANQKLGENKCEKVVFLIAETELSKEEIAKAAGNESLLLYKKDNLADALSEFIRKRSIP